MIRVLAWKHYHFIFLGKLLNTNTALLLFNPFISTTHPGQFLDKLRFRSILDSPKISCKTLGHRLCHLLLLHVESIEEIEHHGRLAVAESSSTEKITQVYRLSSLAVHASAEISQKVLENVGLAVLVVLLGLEGLAVWTYAENVLENLDVGSAVLVLRA